MLKDLPYGTIWRNEGDSLPYMWFMIIDSRVLKPALEGSFWEGRIISMDMRDFSVVHSIPTYTEFVVWDGIEDLNRSV
jgi:hypothetical protein